MSAAPMPRAIPRYSTLALVVLALLRERPMHPYKMQRLIRERAKDRVVNVGHRASLYNAIGRLRIAGLVAETETIRDKQRPERTIYALTDQGRDVFETWMREILASPRREFPTFPAAISVLPVLPVNEVLGLLEQRQEKLRAEVDRFDGDIRDAPPELPRLFVLESELLRAVTVAELEWVSGLVEDLRAGRITWDEDWLREVADRIEGLAGR